MARQKQGSDDYDVGYGRPPEYSQYKPGKSGNPGGRPKKSKKDDPLVSMLDSELYRMVVVKEGGISKKMPILQAGLRRMMISAASGDPKANAKAWEFAQLTATARRESEEASPQRSRRELEEKVIGVLDRVRKRVELEKTRQKEIAVAKRRHPT